MGMRYCGHVTDCHDVRRGGGFFSLDILIYNLLCVGVGVYGTAPGEVKALRGTFLKCIGKSYGESVA